MNKENNNKIMKKAYSNPATFVLTIRTQHLMVNSNIQLGEGIQQQKAKDETPDTEPNRSREDFRRNWDDDDDDI